VGVEFVGRWRKGICVRGGRVLGLLYGVGGDVRWWDVCVYVYAYTWSDLWMVVVDRIVS
jgi:hypothetical protein